MSDYVDVSIRTDEKTAAFARWLGNSALTVMLRAYVLEREAQELAGGRTDADSWRKLFEAVYLCAELDDYARAKRTIAALAAEDTLRGAQP